MTTRVGCAVADRPGHGEAMDARSCRRAAKNWPTLDSYISFGRAAGPERAIVHALQSHGHTVVMTGDGVNDALALKDSGYRCGDGPGSPASRAVAQIVLLNNRFATLPHVVGEGAGSSAISNGSPIYSRLKTVYSVPLALLVRLSLIAIPLRHDPLLFPFQPIHVTIAPGSLS